MAGKEKFEDHCWKDVISADVLDIYSCYRRKVFVGPNPALLAIDLPITERVKWNAPSFCVDGDDRVTMRLQPKDRVEGGVVAGDRIERVQPG